MSELIFEVVQESDGGYCAECLTENVFTQADSWEEMRVNARKAVAAYCLGRRPRAKFGYVWCETKCLFCNEASA